MPTFFELVEQDKIPPEPKRPKGLFEMLLGARPDVLYLDATEQPEKYDDRTMVLLSEIVDGKKKFEDLTLDEQYLLDQATIDFASAPSKKPSPLQKKAAVEEDDDEDDEELEEKTASEDDAPEAELKPYWWL